MLLAMPRVRAGAALLCTRTDAEVHELVADFPNTQGLDFYVSAHAAWGSLPSTSAVRPV